MKVSIERKLKEEEIPLEEATTIPLMSLPRWSLSVVDDIDRHYGRYKDLGAWKGILSLGNDPLKCCPRSLFLSEQ